MAVSCCIFVAGRVSGNTYQVAESRTFKLVWNNAEQTRGETARIRLEHGAASRDVASPVFRHHRNYRVVHISARMLVHLRGNIASPFVAEILSHVGESPAAS